MDELTSLRWDGTELIRTGPAPNFWRAPTDNDFGNGMPEPPARLAGRRARTEGW